MNRNKSDKISKISAILALQNNSNDIENFIIEMLTESELETLSKRWQILEMLSEGKTQREISKDLSVSLFKVTRGAKILKNQKSKIAQYFKKGE